MARSARFALLVILALALAWHPANAQNATSAGDPTSAVNGGTSPDDWFNSVKQSNWDVTDKISGPMEQILTQALVDFGNAHPNGRCQEAAGMQAWQALADSANGGPLEGFLDAIKDSLGSIYKVATFGADPEEAAEAVEAGKLAEQAFDEAKDHTKEWFKDKLKEIWKGKPLEVLQRTEKRGNCTMMLVAIWDRGNQSYEITIYGDCGCASVSTWSMNGSTCPLHTFAVRITGSVVPGIEDGERVLTVGYGKTRITANCNCTGNTPSTVAATPTPEPPTAAPMPKEDGWSKVTTTCKKCQPIVDQIHAAAEARDKMDTDFRTLQYLLKQATDLKEQADIDKYTEQMNNLTKRDAALILLEQRLWKQLKECEAQCYAPSNDSHSYLPKTAQPGTALAATFDDPAQPAGGQVLLTFVTSDRKPHQRVERTDQHHRLAIALPKAIGGVAVTDVILGTARTKIGTGVDVPDTQPLQNVPPQGLAILRGNSAYEHVDGKNIVDLQVRGVDPNTARILLDGKPDQMTTLASSTTSMEGAIDPGVSNGRHTITVTSAGATSNAMPADIIELIPHAPGPAEPGVVETLTIEVRGIGEDPATMTIALSGSAVLASGELETTVPVVNGQAQVQIRGTHAGQALAQFHLNVKMPGYWL